MTRSLLLVLVAVVGLAGCPAPEPEGDAGTGPTDAGRLDARGDVTLCADPDEDGDGEASIACGGSDCDDTDAMRSPTRTEVCDALDVDEDCDATTFGEDDMDGDGHFDAACCNGTSCGDDCDDAAPGVGPTVPEVCDLLDNDCDTRIDEATTPVPWYPDADGDDFGDPDGVPVTSCAPVAGHAFVATDCDDTNASVNPATTEVCNEVDDNCNDAIDEGFGTSDYYPDCDGDLHGSESAAPLEGCDVPLVRPACGAVTGNWVTSHDDCDDTRVVALPGAPETCNGLDDNCNGLSDDGSAPTAWCNDPLRGLHTSVASCTAGACAVVSCASPYLDCSSGAGCETDGASSATNCTACGNSCNWGICGGSCDPLEIDTASDSVCARRSSGTVVCWGGIYGIGDGATHTATPVARPSAAVLSVTNAVQVEIGGRSTDPLVCALTSSGDVWCWGVLAMRFSGYRASPFDLADGALEIAVTGRVLCWRSTGGIRCETSDVSRTLPATADAVEIAGGNSEVCWRRASGTVACSSGLDTAGSVSVVEVPGLTDAVAIDGASQSGSGGSNSFCAVRAGGSVVCWNVGVAPTAVPGTTGAIDVAVGLTHACLWRANGTMACWGQNTRGALGVATGGPGIVEVPGLTDVLSVSAGDYSTCVRRRAGAYCWGTNDAGQLGTATQDFSAHPTPSAVLTPL